MRITFVLPPVNMAGGIRVAAIYATALRRKGHVVKVVSASAQQPTLRRTLKSVLRGQGWPRTIACHSHFDGTALDHYILDEWRPVVDSDVPDADVVIATWWETAEWVAALSQSKGAKVYFIQHHEASLI